jgi:glycosyltransferase involved in cell wall biosynthesis
MLNGVPVVASEQGGLVESVGDAGILVEEYEDVAAWERALARLDDPAVYERYVRKGEERAERHRERQPEMLARFRRELERIAGE